MSDQVVQIMSGLGPPLGLVFYGIAALFGLYKAILDKSEGFKITSPILKKMLNHAAIIIAILIIVGTFMFSLPYFLPKN